MKIIISPAKKMSVHTDDFPVSRFPVYLEETKILFRMMQGMTDEELKTLWRCKEPLAKRNIQRLRQMDLEKQLTPAILAYEGLQYQHMAPIVFTDSAIEYVKKHVRILSGFYGILSPFDGVIPYRLEMQAALYTEKWKDLYEFWGDKIYRELKDEDGIIVNLASKEYSKGVEKYLQPDDRYITVVFGELENGKVKQKGTLAKMARGEMIRYLAENQIEDIEDVKKAEILNYQYRAEYSGENEWVFLK